MSSVFKDTELVIDKNAVVSATAQYLATSRSILFQWNILPLS